MVTVQLKHSAPPHKPFNITSPYDHRFGFWGIVTEVHPEDMTVHVRMDTGFELMGVRVASLEWVTVDDNKDYLSGERHLPPVNTYVYCMCPNGELTSAFVLCSGFLIHQAKHAEFKEKGKENSYKTVENSGWVKETDYQSGTKTIRNKTKEETISVTVDQETQGDEKVTVKIHGTEITVDKSGGVSISTDKDISVSCNKATVSSSGDAEVSANKITATAKGDAELEAVNIKASAKGNAEISSTGTTTVKGTAVNVEATAMTTVKGATVQMNGIAAPTGSGPFCGLPVCLFTGAPHTGNIVTGAN